MALTKQTVTDKIEIVQELLAALIDSGSPSTIQWFSTSGGSGISATGANGFQFSISYMVE